MAVIAFLPLVCAGASRANGVAVPVPLSHSIAGPRLAGDSVVWVVATAAGGFELRTAGTDGAATTFATLPDVGDSMGIQLVASARRVAVAEYAIACDFDCRNSSRVVDNVLTGPLGGPLEQIAGCSPGSMPCGGACSAGIRFDVDVWEDTVAYADRCDRLMVRDYSAPAGTPDTVLPRVVSVRTAGRFVAWPERDPITSTPLRLVVYDRAAAAEAYRVETPVRSFAIQADGKIAFVRDPQTGESTTDVAWASPAEPFAHVVETAADPPEVRIAADRIAVRDAHSLRVQEIRLLTLSGATEASVTAPAPIGDFDFDGRRLAWASRRCEDALVLAWAPGDGVSPAPATDRCPAARVGQRTLRVGRRGPASVRLVCPRDGLLGCAGHVRMLADAARRGRRVRQGDQYLLGVVRYEITAGGRARLQMPLIPEARRFARRHPRAVVRATSIATPPPGSRLAGSFEVRSTTLKLSRQ
jgi:hypothetical protein